MYTFYQKCCRLVFIMNPSTLIKSLKSELKSQGLTYTDVGNYLKMSEAGIKKLLSKEDIPLSKLNSLCQLLQISLGDLLKKAESEEEDVITFQQKTINFFLNSPQYFHFFMKLAYEQKSPREIQEQFQLSSKSINLYLKKLEELNLIKRHPFDRMQILGGIPLAINTSGSELERLKYDTALEVLNKMKKSIDPKLRGAGLCLSEDEIGQFEEKILSIILEFSDKSRRNRKRQKIVASEYTFMSFIHRDSMFNLISELK